MMMPGWKNYVSVPLFGCCAVVGLMSLVLAGQLPKNQPQHLALRQQWDRAVRSDHLFDFRNPDTSLVHQMHLLSAADGEPLLFYADINTPVCIDGVCKPVYLEMYWDLLGRYAGYGTYEAQPLTKYDHDLFLPEDHLKLHELLLDRNSILDRKSLTDLYDLRAVATAEPIRFDGRTVDGISGATKTEIKSSVVAGGLYTCYRLWQLAHGQASEKIGEVVPTLYSDSLAARMLRSPHPEYRYYAVRKAGPEDYAHPAPFLRAFAEGSPLVRRHILQKIPDTIFRRPAVHEQLYADFSNWDLGTKTLLLQKLALAPASAPTLAAQVVTMSKNQLQAYLKFLSAHPPLMTSQLRADLKATLDNPRFHHAYLVAIFLDQ